MKIKTVMELTMVKGLTEDAVKRLASLKTQINTRLFRLAAHIMNDFDAR